MSQFKLNLSASVANLKQISELYQVEHNFRNSHLQNTNEFDRNDEVYCRIDYFKVKLIFCRFSSDFAFTNELFVYPFVC